MVFDPCLGVGQIRFFLKKPGGEQVSSDRHVKVTTWSNRSGGASPSATQHSQIDIETIDHRDRRFSWFKTERVGFEPGAGFQAVTGFCARH